MVIQTSLHNLLETEKKAIEKLKKKKNLNNLKENLIINRGNDYGINLKGMKLSCVPDCIKDLTNVYFINLFDNKLKDLPGFFRNFKNLQIIDLSGNEFEQFPKILTEIPSLTVIKLDVNHISSIPKSISNLKNLETLGLIYNQIKKIPVEIGKLRNLSILNLSNNHIREIPAELGKLNNLIDLNLSSNEIELLPSNLKHLVHLEYLDFSQNNIKSFENIPKTEDLEYFNFNCSHNNIENFNSFSFAIENLKNFCFKGNKIKTFHGVSRETLFRLLFEIEYHREGYNCFNLSKTGQKLLNELLNTEEINESLEFESRKPFENIYRFYQNPTDRILKDLSTGKEVCLGDMERLVHEGGISHRHLLENILPPNHPIFLMYNEKYSIQSTSGLNLLI